MSVRTVPTPPSSTPLNRTLLFRIQFVGKDGVRIAKVLSDGEHQFVAFAAFLAELATADSTSAIVIDEPAAALDHVHRRL